MTCVVYTKSGIAIDVKDSRDALVDWMRGKVRVIEEHEGKFIRSPSISFLAPKSVVLTHDISLPKSFYKAPPLTMKNLKKRDKGRCQYCGRKGRQLGLRELMTFDHIQPKSRGGRHHWLNVVLACNTCNGKKNNRTPEEAGMTLLTLPKIPDRSDLVIG